MHDLNTLYADAKKLTLTLREGLDRLEAAENGGRHGDPSALARDLRAKLQQLQRTTGDMESIWRMHVIRESTTRRDIWKKKVEGLVQETESIRMHLDKFGTREQRRQRERDERDELLARASEGMAAKNQLDVEDQMQKSFQHSNRMIDDMYGQGLAILATMGATKERLKHAHRSAVDVLNGVGLGDSLLRIIARRQRMEIIMIYGGMVLMLLLVCALLWFRWSR